MKSCVVFLWIAALAHVTLAQSPGTFIPTGSTITPRGGHTATLLFNGTVLLAGGATTGFPNQISIAELYDPATGTFTATGNMTAPRGQHSATLLGDGRVLIAGGRNGTSGEQNLTSAELYDPVTGTFTATGALTSLRGLHEATLLPDGRVLMTACAIPCNSVIAELYDPATGRFADAGTPVAGGRCGSLAG